MLAKSGEPSRAHGPPPEPWNATTSGLHHAVLFPTSDGSFRQSHHRRSRAAAPAAAHPKVRQTGVPHSGAAICRLCSHRHPAPYKSLCSPDLPQQATQSEPDGPSPAPSDGDPRDPQVPAVPQPSDQSPPPAFPWIMPSESGIHDPINFSIRTLGPLRIMNGCADNMSGTSAVPQTVCPSLEEATHPRCWGEGSPDWPGRASSKEGESWVIITGRSLESIRRSCAMPLRSRRRVVAGAVAFFAETTPPHHRPPNSLPTL